ncbi:MAG: hypothetical protein BMS9Abin29_0645 [Gemmatimonadota bacterium]|nr:MAG: hypothetical protein BMS9Abin29_0645 [Gemmatimonadota bacterium]
MSKTRIALVAAAILVLSANGLSGQSWRTVTMSRQLGDERNVDVYVQYGAGHFTVGPMDGGALYRMKLRYDEELFDPVAEYTPGELHLGTDNIGHRVRFGRRDISGEFDLELSTNVDMDLQMDFGAVKADFDLGGLRLTDLSLTTGASQTRVDVSEPNPVEMDVARFEVGAAEFTARHLGNLNARSIKVDAGVGDISLGLTGRWQRDARLSVDMGLGSLELRLPEGLGVKIVKDTFLTSFDSEGLVKRGNAYYSVDYEDADRRLTIDIDAAFGSIDVVWVR